VINDTIHDWAPTGGRCTLMRNTERHTPQAFRPLMKRIRSLSCQVAIPEARHT
jgi:hypothetical protein